jgi:mRNA interferase RelE/StbE
VSFKIVYHYLVTRDGIPALSGVWRKKIKSAIESKLTTSPEVFGKPLRKSLRGYRKLRLGDYRVIFRIEAHTIKIFAIAHRSRVYKRVGVRK